MPSLVLLTGTMAEASLPELLSAGAAGGFDSLAIRPSHYQQARAEGLSDADLRALMQQHGVGVSEVDALLQWPEGPAARDAADAEIDAHIEACLALGADTILAVTLSPTLHSVEAAVEGLAHACDRVAPHGLRVALEFFPFCAISTLEIAWQIVSDADRSNGGLALDSWHWFRTGAEEKTLRALPADKIYGVQISDAPAQAGDDLMVEAMQHRLLPGEGDIDLVHFLSMLQEMGVETPIATEVQNETLLSLPPEQSARAQGDALRALCARAAKNHKSPGDP
ncbi:sugar phosphate isomerase/epimerase [Myxococcota bacterium]|nr:sugar phosphate isomerase/epimerase [Myxococcota bacterium]